MKRTFCPAKKRYHDSGNKPYSKNPVKLQEKQKREKEIMRLLQNSTIAVNYEDALYVN